MFWEKIAVLIMQVPWIFSWIINFALFRLHILHKKTGYSNQIDWTIKIQNIPKKNQKAATRMQV